jgi:hypothetical protein
MAPDAQRSWRRWRTRYWLLIGMRAVSLVGLGGALVALSGELASPGGDEWGRESVNAATKCQLISRLSTGVGAVEQGASRWLQFTSFVCAGALTGYLYYDPTNRALFWRPAREWADRGVREFLLSLGPDVRVETRRLAFGRRCALRILAGDADEVWFSCPAKSPVMGQLSDWTTGQRT